jgi:hypothetical protein
MDIQPRDARRGSEVTPRVVFGLCVLTLGVLFLLDRMGSIDIGNYWRFWPVFLIAFGLAKFAQPGGRTFGVFAVGFGTWALLDNLGIVEFDWNYVWPIALILMGASLVWRGIRGGPFRGSDDGKDPGARMSAFAVLGGVDRKYTSQEFRGGDATAVMGGCELDFRQATPAPEGAVLDTFALWGGIDIQVPEDWTVVVQGTPLLGGFSDSRKGAQPNPAKQLIVKGVAIMGGVEVKN